MTGQSPPIPITWAELTDLEPNLLILESYALEHRTTYYKATKLWYGRGGLKKRMSRLVGWNAPPDAPERLRSSRAYECVYHRLFDILSSRKGMKA